ncbi:putative metabolite transport protein CsbC [subsurface metagenome]
MLGVEAIPAIVYTIMVLYVPESPRWLLVNKNDENGAGNVLVQLGDQYPESSIRAIRQSATDVTSKGFWKKAYSFPLILAFLVAFFNQLSGINFILYYAPEIFERAGLATKESLMNSISIGFMNLIFTMLGMYLIDHLGRKALLFWGSIGYIISLGMVAYAFFSGASSVFLLFFILLFIASHAVGQGAVIWVFIAEIFPNRVRAFGQSFGAGTHWVFAALITLITPVFLDTEKGILSSNPWPIFAFFAAFMILQLFFVLLIMPETKGKSLEQLGDELVNPSK